MTGTQYTVYPVSLAPMTESGQDYQEFYSRPNIFGGAPNGILTPNYSCVLFSIWCAFGWNSNGGSIGTDDEIFFGDKGQSASTSTGVRIGIGNSYVSVSNATTGTHGGDFQVMALRAYTNSPPVYTDAKRLSNILISLDLATGVCQIYENGIPLVIATSHFYTTGPMLNSGSYNYVFAYYPGQDGNGLQHPACVGDLWFNASNSFVDLSNPLYRRLFINSDATPVNLGYGGINPFGFYPSVFFHAGGPYPPRQFCSANQGSGGGYGSLSSAFANDDPPSWGQCVPPPQLPGLSQLGIWNATSIAKGKQ